MRIKNMLAKDYESYYYFVGIITLFLCNLILFVFKILNISTQKYTSSANSFLLFVFFLLLLFYIFAFMFRIKRVNKIINAGFGKRMKIVSSLNYPRDQYKIILQDELQLMNAEIILKVSRKNKQHLNACCKPDNIIDVLFFEKNPKIIVFKDIYQD